MAIGVDMLGGGAKGPHRYRYVKASLSALYASRREAIREIVLLILYVFISIGVLYRMSLQCAPRPV